ncbi:hypothetical protein HDU91_000986, partial [Kappamyces sp. JEL0680]
MLRLVNKSMKSIAPRLAHRSYGNLTGAFGAKGVAEEEKFIYDHEKEVLENYKKGRAAAAETAAKQPAQPKQKESTPDPVNPATSSSGVLSGREKALENEWIRKHERELAQNKK